MTTQLYPTVLTGVTPRAANGLINLFVELKIPEEATGFQRNKFYLFNKYIRLFR